MSKPCWLQEMGRPLQDGNRTTSHLLEGDVIMPLITNEVRTTWERHFPTSNVTAFMQDLALSPMLAQLR